ncbi:MAG TPA: 7,8-didemethyl-8-hydroxy-5-deazariboflavin synthase, partial [Gammaproteobacteria bacterium]|nr:7,8-didemethyl-8-hydroxy-5-deazariboflavin synthase [Gammaproteobacteria bacterium]
MMPTTQRLLDIAASGGTIIDSEAHTLFGASNLENLLGAARQRRDQAHGTVVSYSPKVFIPLTKLCRDVCRYCTFAEAPRRGEQAYLSIEEAIDIARAGAKAGCHEALFTLGDQPERRYRAAREALKTLGHDSTIDYLIEAAHAVHEATGLLPHVNPGLMSAEELGRLRRVSVSAGLMLESSAERLTERGGPHHGCPDKTPSL